MWNDTNRYNQTGYSAPTIFPKLWQYANKDLWEIDFAKAERRDASHLEWLEEERAEARIQELEERAERAELNYDY
jgi:hypothetical protein